MFRLILRLLNIRDYEVCPSCAVLKQQLELSNGERQRLTDTLLEIIKPKVVEAAPLEINQISQTSALFSRRRAVMEAKDREEARILQEAKHIGKPDNLRDINSLERELHISEAEKEA
jgi:hypothetical protein